MRTRVIVIILCVCMCVCLSVCYRSSAGVRHVYDKLNLPAKSLLNAKGFQLADFAKKVSFPSYSFFFHFRTAKSAICNSLKLPHSKFI